MEQLLWGNQIAALQTSVNISVILHATHKCCPQAPQIQATPMEQLLQGSQAAAFQNLQYELHVSQHGEVAPPMHIRSKVHP